MLERPADHHQQLVDLERLLQIVERAQLHRFDGALDRRVRRHHENLRRARPRESSRHYRGSDRVRSASGITLSTMRTSNASFSQQALRLRADCWCRRRPVRRHAAPGRGSLRIFSSSSTRRIEPRGVIISLVEVFGAASVPRVRLAPHQRASRSGPGAPARFALETEIVP